MNNQLNEKQIELLKQWALDYDGMDSEKIPMKHIEGLFQENGKIYIKDEEVEYTNVTEYLNSYDGNNFEGSAAINEAKIVINHMFDPKKEELLLKHRLEVLQEETGRLSEEEYEGDVTYEDFYAAINNSVVTKNSQGQLKISLDFELDDIPKHKEWETYPQFVENMTKWYDSGQVKKMAYKNTSTYNHNEDIEVLDELMKASYYPKNGIEAESKNLFLKLQEKGQKNNLTVTHRNSELELANYQISKSDYNEVDVSSDSKETMSEGFNKKISGTKFKEFLSKFNETNQENELLDKYESNPTNANEPKNMKMMREKMKTHDFER